MNSEARISFSCEDIDFSLAQDEQKTIVWISQIIDNHKHTLGFLDFIFCSDEYLLKVNQEHLNHDTYTDIITFNYNEDKEISGDIFISIDRIKENANNFAVKFTEELHRVMIHGVLHLLGFNDKTSEQKEMMRQKEDESLQLYFNN